MMNLHPDHAYERPVSPHLSRKGGSFKERGRAAGLRLELALDGADAHHQRSHSMRVRPTCRHAAATQMAEDEGDGDEGYRPRVYSMPQRGSAYLRQQQAQLSGADDTYKTRSQTSLASSCGERSRASSVNSRCSSGSACEMAQVGAEAGAVSVELGASIPENECYRVVVVGSAGVGKSSLMRQFKTSEYMNGYDAEEMLDESDLDFTEESKVTVLLDGQESDLTFIELLYLGQDISVLPADAFIIIYSVESRSSFDRAVDALYALKHRPQREEEERYHGPADPATILTGNKCDLVRSRVVTLEEGKSVALSYGCKFTETSVGLNHQVDELLIGIVKQIRLRQELRHNTLTVTDPARLNRRREGSFRRCKGLINKVLKKSHFSKSCDNLQVL